MTFLECYAQGCHELVYERPGLAQFKPCAKHSRPDKMSEPATQIDEKSQIPDSGGTE